MLVLFETSAGFAVFKLMDEDKLKKSDNIFKDFETPEKAHRLLKLKQFLKFKDTTEALSAATSSIEGKMSKSLKKMLKKLFVEEAHESLAVSDAKLGNCIKEKLNIQCVSNSSIHELMRCIRTHMESLVSEIPSKDMAAMSLGLAHSLSRYKLKFSPDKVDTMIVQAVSLLDDLDKELNNYVMRCREWYGWHFPELGKILNDNTTYIKTVKAMGMRSNAKNCDLSDILTEEQEELVKENAEISMGTEISEEDILNIHYLCDQVIDMSNYRTQLYDYLQNRMQTIAPNLTQIAGDLLGARLISRAGSLISLAKHPASTVQILGAEKALFRALKAKHDTPKYGIIYSSQLVGQASSKQKGKVARMLANKISLVTRVDALTEENSPELGIELKAGLEVKVKSLEDGGKHRISGTGRSSAKFDVYQHKSHIQEYNPEEDNTIPTKRQSDFGHGSVSKKIKTFEEESEEKEAGPSNVEKKKKKKRQSEGEQSAVEEASKEEQEGKRKKKKKSKDNDEVPDEEPAVVEKSPKKKKRKDNGEESVPDEESTIVDKSSKKKKRKDNGEESVPDDEPALDKSSKKKKKKEK